MTSTIKPNHLRSLYLSLLKFQQICNKYNFNLRDEELEFIDLMTCNKIPLLALYLEDTMNQKQYRLLLSQLKSKKNSNYTKKLEYLYSNIVIFQNEDDNEDFISATQIKSLLKSTGKVNSSIRSEIIINFKNEYPNLLIDILDIFNFNLLKEIYLHKNKDITRLSKEYHLAHGMWNERISSEFKLIESIFIIKKYFQYSKKFSKKKDVSKMSAGIQLLLPI